MRGFCLFLGKMWQYGLCKIFVCYKFKFDDVIELATALKCQKQLLMPSILNLGGRGSLKIAVNCTALTLVLINVLF